MCVWCADQIEMQEWCNVWKQTCKQTSSKRKQRPTQAIIISATTDKSNCTSARIHVRAKGDSRNKSQKCTSGKAAPATWKRAASAPHVCMSDKPMLAAHVWSQVRCDQTKTPCCKNSKWCALQTIHFAASIQPIAECIRVCAVILVTFAVTQHLWRIFSTTLRRGKKKQVAMWTLYLQYWARPSLILP